MYKIYRQDNLELMKSLPDNHINLIYCDILYGTGKNFGDYQDLKADRKIIEEHYLPRITEMKRVLKEDGSIYLQMDTKISHWIRCLMDDVFGYDNFRNEIIWHYDMGARGKRNFACKHDNIFWYSKSSDYTFNYESVLEEFESKMTAWRYKKSGKEPPKGKVPSNVWDINFNTMSSERVGYQTQKPKELLRRIILASSNKNDLVADFYMGSGTTGDVALENGRNFLGCDIGKKAYETTKSRLEKYNKNDIL